LLGSLIDDLMGFGCYILFFLEFLANCLPNKRINSAIILTQNRENDIICGFQIGKSKIRLQLEERISIN